jgi:hypothetical protein
MAAKRRPLVNRFFGKSAALRQAQGRLLALAAATTLGASSAAYAASPTTDPTQAELLKQLDELKAKVEQLEARQHQIDTRPSAAEVDATVERVLHDADRHSQLLDAEGFTAGYNKGKFLIQSADGNFVLNPNLQFQYRFVANSRDDGKNGDDSSTDTGFEVRRLKFSFDGTVYGNIDYKFQWATSRTNGTPTLDEGWVRYKFKDSPFAIRAGSISSDWDHETGVGSKRQLAVERSYLHDVIVAGATNSDIYVQGIQGIYDNGGALRASLAYTDGYASRNTPFTDTGGGSTFLQIVNPQWGVFGRVDYKISGDWKQYDDFTALNSTKDLLVLGGGFEWDTATNINALFHTVDVQWEPQAVKGLSVYGAYIGLQRDFRDAPAGGTGVTYDWGFLAQAGYLLNNHWEVFGRYDYTSFDGDAPPTAGSIGAAANVTDNVHEITGGVNYYIHDHAAKFTADVTWLPNGSPVDLNSTGIPQQSDDSNQFIFRAQFQLLL